MVQTGLKGVTDRNPSAVSNQGLWSSEVAAKGNLGDINEIQYIEHTHYKMIGKKEKRHIILNHFSNIWFEVRHKHLCRR